MKGEAFIRKAYEAILQNDFEQAVASFKEAISLDPDNAEYHYKLSITYARSNRLELALEHAKTAVKLDSASEAFRLHLNRLEAKDLIAKAEECFDGEPDRLYMAVALLRQSIELDGLEMEAHLMLALAYSGLNEFGSALRAVGDALKLDPAHEGALRLKKELEHKLNQYLHSSSDKGRNR